MDVTFANDQRVKCYKDQKWAVRRWGPKIGRRFVDRVNRLHAAKSAQDLFTFPELNFHPLGADRKGEYAMNLDQAWRLIVTFSDKEMMVVRVEEVTDHYDD